MRQLIEQLELFRFSILRLRYLPSEEVHLAKHPSILLRGHFGNQLLAMSRSGQEGCPPCHSEIEGQCSEDCSCLYSTLFQSKVPKNSPILRQQQSAPRPFVFDFPQESFDYGKLAAEQVYRYSSERLLEFNLILIGQALDYVPFIILAFEQFGKAGLYDKIRDKRVPVILEQVDSLDTLTSPQGKRLFSGALKKIFDSLEVLNAQTYLGTLPRQDHSYTVQIDFLSPTQLKYNKSLVAKPSLEILIRALLRRLMALSYVHCQTELDIDSKVLIAASKEAVEKSNHIHTSFMGHYSKRQRQSVYLGGFYGTITFDNVAASLVPLLRLGELVHVGKSTVYGLGKMKVILK